MESLYNLNQQLSPVSPSLSHYSVCINCVFSPAVSPESGVNITPDNMTFNDTDFVELSCITLGGPANSFQWSFNGEELENEITMILTLPNVTAKDGGAYTCNVTNSAGYETYTTYVFISPLITLNPVHFNATNETNEVNFTCDATGFPEPSFEWIKEGDPDFALSSSSTLTIAPVMFGDEGFYFCRATSNDLVVESARATLSSKDSTAILSLVVMLIPRSCSIC